MLLKFLLISACVLAFASAVAAPPAVADDNDFLILTQPNGNKLVIAPFGNIIAIWAPPHGVCKGETQIVTFSINFCVVEKVEDVIKKLQNLPCVEDPHTSAQALRRCK
jgi:hypothetical protein